MKLDAQTLFFSMLVNVLVISVALFVGVRGSSRSGIRVWSFSLVLQGIAWASLIGAYALWPRQLATFGVAAMVASFSLAHIAISHFLRRPFSRGWMLGLPLVTTVVHWVVFDDFVARIAIVNAALGLQMLWMSWLLLRPNPAGRRWRWLAGAALLSSGAMVVGRLGLVLFAPESYPRFESAHWINILGLVVSTANLTVGTLAFLLAHRDEAEQELLRLATTDGLTGVLNRRRLIEQAVDHHQLALRHGRVLAVVMLDIDHFKRINDERGHPAGDRALVLFAKALQQTVRQPDLVGRYGGEEFCIVMPMSGIDAASAVDRRLREAVRRDVVPALGFDMTFSAGVAVAHAEDKGLEELIGRADSALYEAKQAGRNRLVVDGGPGYRRPGPNAAHQSASAQASTMAT